MAIELSGCPQCRELEARLHRAETKLEEILGRLGVGLANGRLMQAALLEYFEPPPTEEPGLRAV